MAAVVNDDADRRPEPDMEVATDRRLAGQAAWQLATQMAGKLASFGLVVIIARGLGALDYGHFAFATSFVPIFLLVGSRGLDVVVARDVARHPGRVSELVATGLALRAVTGVVGLVVAVAVVPLFVEGGGPRTAVVVLAVALFVDELTAYVAVVYKAFERIAFHGLVVLANRVVSTGLALLAILAGGGIVAVSVTYLLGSVGAMVLTSWALRRYFPPIHLRDRRRSVADALTREGIPLTLASTLNALLFRVDTVLLQAIKGGVAVGLYNAAYRFFESFLFVSWVVTGTVLARISRSGPGPEAGRMFQASVGVLLAFHLPMAAGAPFADTAVVTALFGDDFRAAAAALPWLTAAAGLYAIAYLARVAAVALGCQREILRVAALTLVVNVAVNLAVIPSHGFRGAAVATCLAEAVEAVLLLVIFVRANGGLVPEPRLLVPVAAAAVMVATLLVTGVQGWAAVAVGSAVYLPALAAGAVLWRAPPVNDP